MGMRDIGPAAQSVATSLNQDCGSSRSSSAECSATGRTTVHYDGWNTHGVSVRDEFGNSFGSRPGAETGWTDHDATGCSFSVLLSRSPAHKARAIRKASATAIPTRSILRFVFWTIQL